MENFSQLLISGICYCLLFLLCFFVWQMKSENLLSLIVQNGNWFLLHLRHAGGVVIMVLIPLFFIHELPLEVLTWPENVRGSQTTVLAITAIMLFIVSLKDSLRIKNKAIVTENWSAFHAILHVLFRSTFLVSYEWFFRGVLLFGCISVCGLPAAIIINMVLYAAIHSFNGRKEFLCSIPFGLTLCAFTIWWHSVWPAILLHLLLSTAYETMILRHFFYKHSKLIL